MSVAYFIDPQLPAIPATDIACPSCRQTLETIRDGGRHLPERHYPKPTKNPKYGIVIGSDAGRHNADLCAYASDHLYAMVFIEQRHRAAMAVAS